MHIVEYNFFNQNFLNLLYLHTFVTYLRLETAIPLLLAAVQHLPDKDNVVFAFPDDGAWKRFHQFFPGDDTITCVKIRDGKKRIVKVKDGKYNIELHHKKTVFKGL